MSLLRKICRNIEKMNAKKNRRERLTHKAIRQSRVVLDALEPRVLMAADLEALLMPTEMLQPGWGDSVNFELKVSNNGTDVTSGTAAVAFYLDANSNGTLDIGTDLELTAVPNTSLSPETPTLPLDFSSKGLTSGEDLYGTYSITLPSTGYSDGDHTIFVSVDGTAVSDSNTSNNTAQFTIPIGLTAPAGIELYARFVDFDALEDMGELKFGSVYPISVGVHNVGGTATGGAVNVSFYLSPAMILTPDAVLLTTDGTNPATGTTSGVLNGGSMEFVTVNVQMPSSNPFGLSEMYIIAAVDATGVTAGQLTGGAETEVYESNNYRPVENALKLVSTASTSGVDLGAGYLWFGNTPSETVPNYSWGQTTSIPAVNVGVYNAGDTTATAFDVEVKISPTQNANDANAVSLAATTGAAVTANSLEYKNQVLTPSAVPATFGDSSSPTGWAYVYSYIDTGSTNTEANSMNNVSWGHKIWMGSFDGTNPDLSPYELSMESWDDQGYFHWGDSVDLLTSVANVGTATSGVNGSAPITISYYLHDSSDLTDTSSFTPVLLDSSTMIADLATGAIEEVEPNLVISKPGTASTDVSPTYFVVMSIDGGTAVPTEASTANNTMAVEISPYDVTLDLNVSSSTSSSDWTTPPTMHIELYGHGGADLTSGQVDVNFYLSADSTLNTGSDDNVGTYSFNFDSGSNMLSAYGSPLTNEYVLDFSGLSAPADGDYTIFVTISSPSGINFPTMGLEKAIEMPIGEMTAVSGMDLTGEALVFPANSEAYWGSTLDIAMVIENIGDANVTPSFDVQGYLSLDGEIDSSDIALGSPITVTGGVTAGSEVVSKYSVTLPDEAQALTAFGSSYVSNPGQTYRLLFKLDSGSAITEAYEYDNTVKSFPLMISTSATTTPTGVDVAGQHLFSPLFIGISSTKLEWGGSLTVYSDFKNIGPVDETGGFTIKYYLSPTSTLPVDPASDSSILELTASETIASLTAGSSTNVSFTSRTLTIPAMPGSPATGYYIIARATDVTGDTDTTNNDIVMKYDDGNDIVVSVSSPDLIPGVEDYAPEFSSGIYWKFGNQYQLALDVINDSEVAVSGSTIANIYISAVLPNLNTLTVNDLETNTATYTKLTSDLAITFASGEFESINDVTVTMPSGGGWTDGTYYLIYAVDTGESQSELSELNNIGYQAINLVAQSPIAGKTDIEMLDFNLEVNDGSDNYGKITHLAWNTTYTGAAEHLLYNAGDAISGSFTVDYQLTTNGDYASGLASLGSFTTGSTMNSLAISSSEVDIVTPGSGTDGLYFAVAKADSTDSITAELAADRYNNYSRPFPIYIGAWSSGVDLSVFTGNVISGSGQDIYQPGDTIQVDYQIANLGDTQAQPFTVEFYLSSDSVATSSELLTPLTIDPSAPGMLAGSGSYVNMTATLEVPAAVDLSTSGNYYVIVKVVSDSNDTDVVSSNDTIAMPVTIESAAPEYDISITGSSSVQFISASGTVIPSNPIFNIGMSSVGLSVNITNNGSSPTDPYNVKIGLYSDSAMTNLVSGSETIMTGVNINGNSSASLNISSLPLSAITVAGTYYLGITLDVNNELDESQVSGGESNNTIAVPVVFEAPKPDIAISSFSIDGQQSLEATLGDILHVSLDLVNGSQVSITSGFDVCIDLLDSSGAVVSGCSWTQTVSSLNSSSQGNNHASVNMDITLPSNLAITSYTLVARADSGAVVAESDETNNTSNAITLTLTEPEIDLVLQPLVTPTGEGNKFFWGSEFYFNFQLNEFGDSASPQTKAAVYLSSSASSVQGALLLQEFNIPQLVPDSFYPVEGYLQLPNNIDGTYSDGSYYLLVVVDSNNDVDEVINGVSAESNNIRSVAISVGSPNVDLKVDTKSDTEAIEVIRSVPFDIPLSVYNNSLGVVNTPFTLRAVVSQDNIVGNSDDYVLGSVVVSHLDPYASFEEMLLVDWPAESVLADGTYRIIITADVDNAIAETYVDGSPAEDNNQGTFYIRLTTLELTNGVDLMAGDFDNEGNGNFSWGSSYNMHYGLLNNGLDDAGSFDVDFVLSRDNKLDSNDVKIGSYTVSSGLASGMVYMSEITINMPDNADSSLSDGAYFIIMSVDGKELIIESDELNNTISRVVSMGNLPDGIDFEVGQVDIVSSASYGETITVTVPVTNNGSDSQWAQLSVYASNSPITTATLNNAWMIGSFNLVDNGELGAGQTAEIEIEIILPGLQQGVSGQEFYNLLFIVDAYNTVQEFNETNNDYYHTIILSQEILPDLQVWPVINPDTEMKYIPGAGMVFNWGDTLNIDAHLNNWSTADVTDSFKISYYLSAESPWSDDFDSSELYQLTSKTVSSIAGNGFVIVEGAVVSLPETAPERFVDINNLYLVSMVDSAGAITESNEDNNYGDMPIYIGQIPADLSGYLGIRSQDGQGYPQMNYLWGETVPVAINLQNYGGGDAENFTITYYLAQDWSFQNVDGSLNMNKLVAVGSQVVDLVEAGAGSWNPSTGDQSEPVTVNYDLVLPDNKPGIFTGNYFGFNIVAVIDSGNVVSEYDDTWNNIATNYVNIEKASSDLVGFYINPLDPATGTFKTDGLWSDTTTTRQVRVSGNIANFGNVAAENVTIAFYLADASGNLGTAYELGQKVIDSLSYEGIANHLTFDYTFNLPTSDSVDFVTAGNETGSYSIIMVVDPEGDIDEINEGNNIAVHPYRLVKQTGKVSITDSVDDPYDKEIDFGSLLANDQATAWVNIRNNGEGRLTVTGLTTDNQVFAIDQDMLPLIIEPGQSYDLAVTLNTAGLMPGSQQGNLRIFTDDPRRPDGTEIDLAVIIKQNPVDLAVTSMTAVTLNNEAINDVNADAYWGDTLRINLAAGNISSVNTTGPVYLDLYLYDPANSANNYSLRSGYSLGTLAGQGTYSGTLEITLPQASPFGYSGNLSLGARLYSSTQDFEKELDNNTGNSQLYVVTKPQGKADIKFSYVNMTEEAAPGEELSVDFGVINYGKADAGTFDVKVYLSDNASYGTTDILVSSVNIQGLAVGKESAKTLDLTLPANAQEGLKYLIFVADGAGVLDETSKLDNTSSARFNIEKGPEVDLSISTVVVDNQVIIGSDFNIDLTVLNSGTAAANNVTVDLFLKGINSSQSTPGSFIGTFTIDTIAAGGSYNTQYKSFMPSGAAISGSQYNVVAVVDRQQKTEEISETNNTTYSNTIMADAGSIDLVGTLGEVPDQARWGEGFDVTLSVMNTGEIESPAYNVKVVLSRDMVLSDNDLYLTSWTRNKLPAGESRDTNLWVWLPDNMNLTDGNYYVLAAIDNGSVVNETNESNNLIVSNAIAVAGVPDLYGYLQSLPASANFGQTITITDKVQNNGNAAAGEFEVGYFLSQDADFDSDLDVKLGSRIISSLAADGTNYGTVQLDLIQPAGWAQEGQLYIVMLVDQADAIAEQAEELMASGATPELSAKPISIIATGKPDIEAVSVAVLTDDSYSWSVNPQDPSQITIEYELENIGTADSGSFTVTFYMSTNTLITAENDFELGSITVSSLAAETTLADFAEFTLPAVSPTGKDGDFYIGMIVDKNAQVAEFSETNNKATSAVTSEFGNVVKVDLVANDIYGPTSGIIPGQSFSVYAGVFNAGSEPSESFTIDFYITSAGVIDSNAILIGSETMSPVNANAYSGQSIVIDAMTEQQLGNYVNASGILAMQINPAHSLQESNYNNNFANDYLPTMVSQAVTQDAAAIDLTSADDLNDIAWGDALTLSYSVTPVVETPVKVQFVLKNNLSGSTYALSTATVASGSSDQEGSVSVSLPANSPFGYDGQFVIEMIVDPDDELDELSEVNNSQSLPVTIGSGKSDLVALDISSVPTISSGSSMTIYSGIANYGTEDAYGFEVYYYLTSSNTQIDQDDDIMLTSINVSSLGGQEYFWNAPAVTIPNSVTAGSYYIAMLVDKYDDIEEAFETNNTSFSYMPIFVKTASVSPDSNEPDNNISSATIVTLTDGRSELIEATIHEADNSDYFSFTTPANGNGLAMLNVKPDDYLNASLTIYDQNSSIIATVDMDPYMGGEEVFTSFTLSPGRTYYVEVDGVGGSVGSYEMEIMLGTGSVAGDSYEANNTMATAYYLGSEDMVLTDVSIHNSSDMDYYMFTVPGDSTGSFHIESLANPELDLVMRLYNASGSQIASSDVGDAGDSEGIEYDGEAGAVYYLAFSSWAGSVGGYGFGITFEEQQLPDRYEDNNSLAQAYTLTSGSTVNIYDANINTQDDEDYYTVTVPAGSTSIEVSLYASDEFDGVVSLYNSTGRLLRSVDQQELGGTETLVSGGLTAGQVVYIAVASADGSTGYYGMNASFGNKNVGDIAEPNDTMTQAYYVDLSGTTTKTINKLSIHTGDDADFFELMLPTNSDGSIIVTGIPDNAASLNLALRLRDASGNIVKAVDLAAAGETETMTVTGLIPGQTYYASARGWNTTGDYKLTIETPRTSAAINQPELVGPYYPGQYVSPLGSMVPALTAVSGQTVVIETVGTVNDDILSFGTASSGSTSTGEITIRNTSGSAQTYTLAITGDDAFTVSSSSVSVAAGSARDITVSFSPDTTGSVTGTLTITDGSDNLIASMPLSGTGTVSSDKPDIQLVNSSSAEISSLAFPTTEPENNNERSFRIRNLGSSALTITSVTITGTDAADFSLIGSYAGRSVVSGTPLSVRLAFEPLTIGNKSASLVITTNDPDEPTVTVPLTGTSGTADLEIDLEEVDFGTVLVDGEAGNLARQQFNLSNSGNTTLNIQSFGFTGNDFYVTDIAGTVITSLDIAAGGSAKIIVVFDPTIEGVVSDTLTFNCNDNDSPTVSIAADAITGYTTDPLKSGTLYFHDSDGDIFKIIYRTTGDMTFSAGEELDNNTLAGAELTVDVLGDLGNGYIKVRDTNRGIGDGILNFDSITIDSNFRLIDIDGTINELSVDGFLGSLIAESFNKVNIEGTVGKMIVNGQLDSAEISVGQLTQFTARNNIIDSSLTSTSGLIKTVSLLGQSSELDITSAGRIDKITAKGDFSGNITAADSLGNVSVMGSIYGSSWNVTSATNTATVNKMYARKGIDIDSFLVDGTLKTLTAGSNRYKNGLTGNITANNIGTIRVYGDLDSVIRANSSLNRWSVTGQISGSSHIYENDLDLLLD